MQHNSTNSQSVKKTQKIHRMKKEEHMSREHMYVSERNGTKFIVFSVDTCQIVVLG